MTTAPNTHHEAFDVADDEHVAWRSTIAALVDEWRSAHIDLSDSTIVLVDAELASSA